MELLSDIQGLFKLLWFFFGVPLVCIVTLFGIWIYSIVHPLQRNDLGWALANLLTVITSPFYFFYVKDPKWGWIMFGVLGVMLNHVLKLGFGILG